LRSFQSVPIDSLQVPAPWRGICYYGDASRVIQRPAGPDMGDVQQGARRVRRA
jgi:hypothetical protein